MIRPEPLERALEGECDVSRIEVHSDSAMVEVTADLRRDMNVVPTILEGLAEDLLAVAPPVYVRRVDEIHAEFDRAAECGDRFCVVRRAV